MRAARRSLTSQTLIAALAIGFLLSINGEAKPKKTPSPEPAPTPDHVAQLNRRISVVNHGLIRKYFPPFMVGSLALIAIGLSYHSVAWVFRAPCRRCGSRSIRVQGTGSAKMRRCLRCGHADANRM